MRTKKRANSSLWVMLIFFCLAGICYLFPQESNQDYEKITSDDCSGCHEKSKHGTDFTQDLSHSIHEGFECLDCHLDKKTFPHQKIPDFELPCHSCASCHEEEAQTYKIHG